MPTEQQNDAAAAKAAEDKRKARDASVKAAEETLDKQDRESAVNSAEAMRRMNESRPTPTQRENDLARLGHHVMEKEDDGSGPDPATLSEEEKLQKAVDKRKAMESGSAAPYRTRETVPARPSSAPVATATATADKPK